MKEPGMAFEKTEAGLERNKDVLTIPQKKSMTHKPITHSHLAHLILKLLNQMHVAEERSGWYLTMHKGREA